MEDMEMDDEVMEQEEEAMEDEEEVGVEEEAAFTVVAVFGDNGRLDIDLDYEFDAPMFFDFCRAESPAEAWEAQRWFQTAPTYPPSPFMSKMFIGSGFSKENVNIEVDEEICHQGRDPSELETLYKSDAQSDDEKDSMQDDTTSHISESILPPKVSAPKASTLLKPTASQLAKQNRLRDLRNIRLHSNRFLKPPLPSNNCVKANLVDNASQAPKRQKTDRGYLQKASDVKQEQSFLHKASKQKQEPVHGTCEQSKLRLTIPREPELRTARRAHRIRAQDNQVNPEQSDPNTYVFKARPLNRKILEAPTLPLPTKSTPRRPAFHEFNLKTSERATQHVHAAPSSSQVVNKISKPLMQSVAAKRSVPQQGSDTHFLRKNKNENEREKALPSFKARPLNKKILTSRGDMGVFQSNKREVTKPVEFNFSTDRKSKYVPPTELFKKLSLAPDKHHNSKYPKSSSACNGMNQDLKENIMGDGHSNVKVLHALNEENHRPEKRTTCTDRAGRICDSQSQTNNYRKSCR